MQVNKTPIAVAVLALTGAMPIVAEAAPTATWTQPQNGAVLRGRITGSQCTVGANSETRRVSFYATNWQINNDYRSPFNCDFDTTRLRDGEYTLRARAFDASGAYRETSINVTIANNTAAPTPEPTPTPTPTPPPTSGTAPTIAFTAPAEGGTLSGNVQGPPNCIVQGSNIARVMFYLNDQWTNTDGNLANGLGCWIDTTRYPNGSYTVRAVAYNAAGETATTTRSIRIQNGAVTEPTPTNTPPTVSITSPTASQTVSSSINYAASATDNAGVARVLFFLDGSTTPLATDTSAPYGGSLDTATLANGAHTLRAVAYDAAGLNTSTQVAFNVQNTAPGGGDTPPVSNLPSTGVNVVPTFQSLGVTWSSPGAGATGCKIQYRKAGDTAFKPGLDMWYDSRNNQCRGSLVELQSGSDYEIQLGLPGQAFSRGIVAKTWSEQFPIAQTITLPAGTSSQQLVISQGGTPNGYVLYQAAPEGSTIDVQDAYASNIRVSAPYVIIRGLTLRGARQDAIELRPGAHDVVIENNDISGWGRFRTTAGGQQIGMDMDSAVRAHCGNDMSMQRFIMQRNRMHNPRYATNSWDSGHPAGPQGVTFSYCGGNHVIRYNEIDGGSKFFNDGIGGEDNFTNLGAPHSDSDIHGNVIRNVRDDGIEVEGKNRNVRIYRNYIDQTAIGIASTVTHEGPLYIFRNVVNRQRFMYNTALDSDQRGNLLKSGSGNGVGNGRRYVFHNTSLQASASGATRGLGAGGGLAGNTNQPLTNTVSRNNILHVWTDTARSVYQTDQGANNDVDYDLYNGRIFANAGAEANGIQGRPTYRAGHGWQSEANGLYQLEPGTPGHDRGAMLPNFNDGFIGTAPDMGAAETGAAAMKFGTAAAGVVEPVPGNPAPSNTPPTVSIGSPSANQTVSGTLNYAATATDNAAVARVVFTLDGSSTALQTDTSSPYGGSLNTATLANGTHTLRAVAFDADGLSTSTQVSFNVQNTAPTPPVSGTAPTIAFTAPAEGGTLSGNVQGPPNCIVQGSNIARVMFYLNDQWTNTDGNLANGLGCWIDTTRFANGSYTVRAVAYNAAGETATTTRSIRIQNGSTTTPDDPAPNDPAPTPTGSPIATADILGQASSEIPFAQQSGYGGQVLGQYPSPSEIPETTGIQGTLLPNGERIRLGKQADPRDPTKKALVFQLAPTDPDTSGNPRAEISFSKTIEYNRVYWVAMRAYIHDWGTLASNDVSVFGTQMHSGDNSRGLSPSFSLIANNGGRTFQVYAVTSTSGAPSQSNSVTTRYSVGAIPFGRWVDFVFKFRHNVAGNGLLQVWMDGQQIVNHTGNLGFNTPGFNDYAKFGYYNWSAGFNSPRKVMLKAPTIVRDPTGSTYTPADLRAHINK